MAATVQPDCDPCIDRTAYTLRAILHGTSDDDYWQKLAASARQSALDMRVNLELELYPPGGYSDDRMASDIRNAANGSPNSKVNALIVTIPSETVAKAVRYASGRGMPIFGLNSGYEEVSGRGGLIEEGAVKFFTAMNERLGGEVAAEYFLREFGFFEQHIKGNGSISLFDEGENDSILLPPSSSTGPTSLPTTNYAPSEVMSSGPDTIPGNSLSLDPSFNVSAPLTNAISWDNISDSGTGNENATIGIIDFDLIDNGGGNNGTDTPTTNSSEIESATNDTARISNVFDTRNLELHHTYKKALFISPLGEKNSAYQQRYDGYRDKLIDAGNATAKSSPNNTYTIINVDWYELDTSTQDTIEQGLTDIMSGCQYQSVLVGAGKLSTQVYAAIEANSCHTYDWTNCCEGYKSLGTHIWTPVWSTDEVEHSTRL